MKRLPFFISIEGNIGAGKTTLAKILAKELNASLLLEKFEQNPHLEKFYKNPKQHALPVELWFLAERFEQMKSQISNLKSQILISDYNIDKCLIFAKANLSKEDFLIYKKFFEIIQPLIPQPNLLIYLHQNLNQLRKNIQKRGRTYEKKISFNYLNKIQKGYESYIRGKNRKRVLILDCHSFNLLEKDPIETLVSRIERTLSC
ncbi:MAG: deoxynucleoside kinase [Bacteroidetes bacterium]|nr:deoxynucleoside kinase [Bacteroidota bacterium]